MHFDPILPAVVGTTFIGLIFALVFRHFKLPLVLAYILTGLIVGPQCLSLINNIDVIETMGSLGVILLLFFIGMEVSPDKLRHSWRISIGSTGLQIVLSLLSMFAIGSLLNWSAERIVLLGFVLSLSSTAVVLKLMQDKNELHSEQGQHVLGILLVQDLAVIPMVIVIGIMDETGVQSNVIAMQVIAGIVVLLLVRWLLNQAYIEFRWLNKLKVNHELQVIGALLCCFGLSLLSGLMHLSTALGAFVGGMLVAKMKDSLWIRTSLEAFHVVFIAIFFMSIGMLLNIHFILQNSGLLTVLLLMVLVGNTLIATVTLRALKVSWAKSVYAAAMLAQVGEFSFILATLGRQSKLISDYGYHVTVAVIALSLFASPFWVALARKIVPTNTVPTE